jgi:large subunit ribosomal protein L33
MVADKHEFWCLVVGGVEFRETHRESGELVGLVKLDPPYVLKKLCGPINGTQKPLEHSEIFPYNCGFPQGRGRPTHLNPKLSPLNAPMAAGKRKKKVETVFLVCEESGDHNYTLRRKTGGEKLKLKKFSPRLRKHTMHTEKKK